MHYCGYAIVWNYFVAIVCITRCNPHCMTSMTVTMPYGIHLQFMTHMDMYIRFIHMEITVHVSLNNSAEYKYTLSHMRFYSGSVFLQVWSFDHFDDLMIIALYETKWPIWMTCRCNWWLCRWPLLMISNFPKYSISSKSICGRCTWTGEWIHDHFFNGLFSLSAF